MLIPDKNQKVEQHNFPTYNEARSWLLGNGYKCHGYLTEKPWAEFFVSYWKKGNFVALQMNITNLLSFNKCSVDQLNKPYQIDVAKTD